MTNHGLLLLHLLNSDVTNSITTASSRCLHPCAEQSSASFFKSRAYLSNINLKSGNLFFISANTSPLKRSAMMNPVERLLSCLSSKLREPLKIGAKPLLHVILLFGTMPDTLGVNVRSVPGTCIRIRSPSCIFPSMALMVEFQLENLFASVNSFQISSAFA